MSRALRHPALQRWTELWLLSGVALYLYARLFAFPNIPFLLDGDQTFFWVYALRMLHGERIYMDFFQFHPPGTDLFYATLFKLFGPHIWVTNFAVLLLGVLLCWLCFSVAKQLMEWDLAALAALLFVVLLYGARLDATHHWLSLLAAMCAIRVMMSARTGSRVAAAGALLGVASFVTQTVGIAGAVALLLALAWERSSTGGPWRTTLLRQLLLLLAFGLVWSALSGHFIGNVGWKQFWYFQVTYPRNYLFFKHQLFFPATNGSLTPRALPDLAQRLFVYLLWFAICPWVVWDCWVKRRELSSPDDIRPVMLAMIGLSLQLVIITRVNWNRLYAVAMPALILLVWIARSSKLRRHATTALWLVIAGLTIKQIWSEYHHPHWIAELPAGRTVLSNQNYEEYSWLSQHTIPGDYFFQSSWLNFYVPLELRSPVFVDGLWSTELTRPEYVALTVRQIEQKQVKYILWTPRWTEEEVASNPEENHLGPFRAYLASHYARIHIFSTHDEVWQRK
jgi:hypothetical protein